MFNPLIDALLAWFITGGIVFIILFWKYFYPLDKRCIFRPDVIYELFNVNFFSCVMLTLLFNLICPIVSIVYWIYKLCTIGRD